MFFIIFSIHWFSYKGKVYKIKLRFGVKGFQDPPLCGSTKITLPAKS
jgi:hypothetical protein